MTNPLTTNAQRVRISLSVILCLTVVAAIAAVYYAITELNSYSHVVQESVYNAETSQSQIDATKKLVNQMNNNPTSVARVESIVADSKSYQYQDVIITDLRAMAARAGVSIVNFDFSAGDKASGSAASSSASQATPSSSGSGSATPSTTPTVAAPSLKSTTVNVSLANPVDYNSFLQFLHYIEQNNTKMQVSKVSLSAAGNAQAGKVSSDALTIEVYIR